MILWWWDKIVDELSFSSYTFLTILPAMRIPKCTPGWSKTRRSRKHSGVNLLWLFFSTARLISEETGMRCLGSSSRNQRGFTRSDFNIMFLFRRLWFGSMFKYFALFNFSWNIYRIRLSSSRTTPCRQWPRRQTQLYSMFYSEKVGIVCFTRRKSV